MCGIEELARKAKPIVYSMGINGQSDWEADMLERTNSELYGYDFSVTEVRLSCSASKECAVTKRYSSDRRSKIDPISKLGLTSMPFV